MDDKNEINRDGLTPSPSLGEIYNDFRKDSYAAPLELW